MEIERANLELRRNFFVVRAAKAWNALPEKVKEQRTVIGFKNAYDAWRWKEISNTKPREAVAQVDGADMENGQ